MERFTPNSPQEQPDEELVVIPSADHDANDTEAEWGRWRQLIHPAQLEAAERLYEAHGDAFVIYLDNYYPEQVPLNIEADFEAIYMGTFDNADEWAMSIYDATGWQSELREALRERAIPGGAVTWNPGFLVSYAESMGFRRHERDGQLHIFQP